MPRVGQYRVNYRIFLSVSILIACLLLTPVSANELTGPQLSVHRYDVADGLAHSSVRCIHQDAKGYLWVGTQEGLSRFDGYGFTNYGPRDALGHPYVNAIAEDRKGHLWLGTNGGGVSRLIDDPREAQSLRPAGAPPPRFINYRIGDSIQANSVNRMLFDLNDNLWCVTDAALYRASLDPQGTPKFEVVVPKTSYASSAAFADHQGRLWFGLEHELIEINQKQMIIYGAVDEVGEDLISGIVEDDRGRLLVSSLHALFEFEGTADPNGRGKWHRLPLTLNRDQKLGRMINEHGGALLIATNQGLMKYRDAEQTLFTTAQGLSNNEVVDLSWDVDGNLWVGTWSGGLSKISNHAIVSFTRAEGLPEEQVVWVTENREGGVYASTRWHGLLKIVDGKVLPLSGSELPPFNTINSRLLQDSHGDWWIGTEQGLFRIQGPDLQFRDISRYASRDRVSAEPIALELCEDASGKVWLATANNVYWFMPGNEGGVQFHRPAANPLVNVPNHLICDRGGAVWLGSQEQLGRLTNGNATIIETAAGLPETNPRAFFFDSRGWLWIGLRYKGVSVTKDPNAENLQFVNYSTANGLASDTVWSITEDDAGRMYFGTGRGLDRLDLTTGGVRHFTVADGLAGDLVNHCIKDRDGNIWSATDTGVSKLDPRAEHVNERPPPVYLSRVQIAGEDLPLAERGVQQSPAVDLSASRNNLVIDFIGLAFQGELKYQYKLEGTTAGWSAATDQRSVNFARLAPGSYRFLVRAINSEGLTSSAPAVFEFRILPPVWLRWWFLLLVAMLACVTVYLVYRYRVRRLLELERVRSRIASDLHDDIGSGLSRMAILSEVVKHQTAPTSLPLLTEIAESARDLVDSMSDIVWATDPRRDDLNSVISRVGRFATSVLEAKGIKLEFESPQDSEHVKLDPEQRRHLLLIFKEAINNIVRHADCRRASVNITLLRHRLIAEIRDDGNGFEPQSSTESASKGHGGGRGLENMQRRAVELGGDLTIQSTPGQGTILQLSVPIKRSLA